MKYRCKKCKLEGNVGVCDDKVCVGFDLGSTTTQNDWANSFTKLIKDKSDYPAAHSNQDGFNCTPDEMKDFIANLLADARKEVIRQIEEMPIETVGNSAKTVDQILATLRKEQV